MEAPESRPLLPRISMRWYFVIVVIVAFLVSVIFKSSNPQAWVVTLVLVLGAIVLFGAASALCFLVAYVFGSVKQIVFYVPPKAASPFATDTLPPQVIPPESARD